MSRRIGLVLFTLVLTCAFGTVAAAAPLPQSGQLCFPQTNYCMSGRIREFWEENGGLPVFGYPIGDQRAEVIEGGTYQAQWFERNRLELHPENARPYDVLIGRIGVDRLKQQGRDWMQFARSAAQSASSPRLLARLHPDLRHRSTVT